MTSIRIEAFPIAAMSPTRSSPRKTVSSINRTAPQWDPDEDDGYIPMTPTSSSLNMSQWSSPSRTKKHSFDSAAAPSTPKRSSPRRTKSASSSPARRTPLQRRKSTGAVEHSHKNTWHDHFSAPSTPSRSTSLKKNKSAQTMSPSPSTRRKSLSGSPINHHHHRTWDRNQGNTGHESQEKILQHPSPRSRNNNVDESPYMTPKQKRRASMGDKKAGKVSSPLKLPSKRKTSPDQTLNLSSLVQSLGEIRSNLSASPMQKSPRRSVDKASSSKAPKSPKSPTTKQLSINRHNSMDVCISPRPINGKIPIVAYSPVRTATPEKTTTRPVVSPRKKAGASQKRKAPATPTQTTTVQSSPQRKQRQPHRPIQRSHSLPEHLPLTTTTTAPPPPPPPPKGILRKQPKYAPGPVTRRDGKIYEDHWSPMGKSKYLGIKKKKNNKAEPSKTKKSSSPLQVKSWSAAAKQKDNRKWTQDFIFDATAYLDDVLFGDKKEDSSSEEEEEASKDAAASKEVDVAAYPIINIAPVEDDDHSSVSSSSSESSYEEIEVVIEDDGEVIEEAEVIEKEVMVEESSDTEEEEERCNACGLQAFCVPEGMVSCLRCRKVSYCSVDCMQWDFTSGDHLSVCVEIK